MLEKHYGHTSNVVNAAEPTKRTGGSRTWKIGAQAAIYEYVASLEPVKDEKLSIALRIHFLKRSEPLFQKQATR